MATFEIDSANMVSLAERRVFTQSFQPTYAEGMGLLDDVAEYLDGDGRVAFQKLSSAAATVYEAESMRLTTRLMQIASWLLLHRAANDGEMSRQQVASEKSKLNLYSFASRNHSPVWNELPEEFRELVARSVQLEGRVRKMDHDISDNVMHDSQVLSMNPVSDQLVLLQTAFSRN